MGTIAGIQRPKIATVHIVNELKGHSHRCHEGGLFHRRSDGGIVAIATNRGIVHGVKVNGVVPRIAVATTPRLVQYQLALGIVDAGLLNQFLDGNDRIVVIGSDPNPGGYLRLFLEHQKIPRLGTVQATVQWMRREIATKLPMDRQDFTTGCVRHKFDRFMRLEKHGAEQVGEFVVGSVRIANHEYANGMARVEEQQEYSKDHHLGAILAK